MIQSGVTQTLSRNIGFLFEDASVASSIIGGSTIVPYIGLVGYHNLGDDVLYEAHQKLFPSHRLVPYRKDSVIVEKAASLFHRPFSKHAILGGGTLINDGDVWLNKARHLLEHGNKMFCIGTGAESSAFYGKEDTDNPLLQKWLPVLEQFEFIGVRGPQSKAILDSAGAKNVIITGDTALSLTEETMEPRDRQGVVGITYGDVAGNPMWGDPKRYRVELVKVIRSLIEGGSKILLLPIWSIDIPSNESLLQEINHPNCTMVKAYESYESFSEQLRKCDVFIGQKLHSTILALMNRVPSIMVEYRPKCRDFMSSLGLEEYIIKTSDLTLDSFMGLYDKVLENYDEIRTQAETKILEYKHLQFKTAEKLNGILAQ